MAQNAYAAAAAAAAAQQSPYVLNPGQDPAAPYMGLIPGMHQYYGVGPWVYPPGIIPQQGSQPRRPLTPSQGTDNAPYQVCTLSSFLVIYFCTEALLIHPQPPFNAK